MTSAVLVWAVLFLGTFCRIQAKQCLDMTCGAAGTAMCEQRGGTCSGDQCCILEEYEKPCPERMLDPCDDAKSCTSTDECGTDTTCCTTVCETKKCLPDLSMCVDVKKLLPIFIGNVNCIAKVAGVLGPGSFEKYCSSLLAGLECASVELMKVVGPSYSDLCFARMRSYIKNEPTAIAKEIKQYIPTADIPEEYTNESGKCKVPGEDDSSEEDDKGDDADWNASCPNMDNEGGLCPTDCTTNDECPGENMVCCNAGGDECHRCMPDLKQCGDVGQILISQTTQGNCLPQLMMLGQAQKYSDYCSAAAGAFNCLAEKVMPSESRLCSKRMAEAVQRAPNVIIDAIKLMLQGQGQGDAAQAVVMLIKFVKDTARCKEFYQAPPPLVPDGVKDCFDLGRIMSAAGQCRRITSSSVTNEACGNLKTLIECIAEKLVSGDDEIKRKKCAGEVYKFVNENRQRVSNIFGNVSPEACEERNSVCGGGLKPADGVTCRTSRCPAKHTCKDGYCCPEERSGVCPKLEPGVRQLCRQECNVDSECDDDEKCCSSASCGHKTCLKFETEPEGNSKCEMEFENGKRQLARQGVCGKGKTLIMKLSQCQSKGYRPAQYSLTDIGGYCINENGEKINGSNFMGNRDCTKVRNGMCPPLPSQCTTVAKNADTCQSDDFLCNDGEKCCITYGGSTCLKRCVPAETAPETEMDDCADRKCCPVTLCHGKVCMSDVTAICRINSCGGCKAEFYNLKGKVDCDQGVTTCRKDRAAAIEQNSNMLTSDFERISSLIDARDGKERKMKDDADYEDDEEDDEYDDEEEEDDDEKEKRTDEYGIEREKGDYLPEDGEEMGEMGDIQAKVTAVYGRLCAVIDKFHICQNGGECKLGTGESFYEFCRCNTGYSGILCEIKESVTPNTKCNRDKKRVESLQAFMNSPDNMKEKIVFRTVFNTIKPPQVMTSFTCQQSGLYDGIQAGIILPKSINTLTIYYCVDPTTGMRKEGTPVTMVDSGIMPNCSVTTAFPDIMSLPRKCMASYMPVSNESDTDKGPKVQYFWNQASGMCEKGKAGIGFLRLTDCYNQCGILRACTNAPAGSMDENNCEKVVVSGPTPCKMTMENNEEVDTCDYERQFCHVEETTSGHRGTCIEFPGHCLQTPDKGHGGKSIRAYYFNAKKGKCMKMVYHGLVGNGNRFYSQLQCQTECGTRSYKQGVCPIAELHDMSMTDQQDQCDEDDDCYGREKCCVSGKRRACTSPLRTCFTSVRCSLLGSCSEGRCTCNSCDNTPKSEVCGSDGTTYHSLCHLEKKACETMRDITVVFNGTCKTPCGNNFCHRNELCENNLCKCADFCIEVEQPVCGKSAKSGTMCTFGNTCKMARTSCQMKEIFVPVKDGPCNAGELSGTCKVPCTKDYNPVCVRYDSGDFDTYSNPCLVKEAMLSGKQIQVIGLGPCFQKCGETDCGPYRECVYGTCKCQEACPKVYKPVCGHVYNNNNIMITFPNTCLMRLRSCVEEKIYVIAKHGECKEPEAMFNCPVTRPDIPDIPYSAVVDCKPNAYCNTENGEMCCPYGAGMKCLPRKALVRSKTAKSGICPKFSLVDFDAAMCESSKCTIDNNCDGEAKCCDNDVCGHMTCAAPKVRDADSPCGANEKMVSECSPGMTMTRCPSEGTCRSVTLAENEQVGVCCIPDTEIAKGGTEGKLVRSKVCALLEMTDNKCLNGGTCVGDIRNGKVCECMDGYFGPFCRGSRPPVPCDKAVVQCVVNPCDVNTCPGVPEATCEANYCGGCNAIFKKDSKVVSHLCHDTKCLVQKAVMAALEKAIYINESTMEHSDEDASKRRRRDTESGMADDMDKMMGNLNPFNKMLMYLMMKMGMPARLNLEQLCAPSGTFNLEQCAGGMNGSRHCFCVDRETGIPIPRGPRVSNLETLNCSDLSSNNMGQQTFCLSERPRKGICGSSMTNRFFYNIAKKDCERFSDFGCNVGISNNFASYETCKSSCGVRDTRLSQCTSVRCGFGQGCIIDNGNAVCVDPVNAKPKFEPVCDDDGKFGPKQCIGDLCKCVNPDTGATIADSVAEGIHLKCQRDGEGVTADRSAVKLCSGGKPAVFCENGGDVCNNCEMKNNQEGTNGANRIVDDNNVCISCESCPTGQGREKCDTEKLCKTKCKEFYNAVCQINRCTCTEEYIANGEVVNCTAIHGQCLKERQRERLEEIVQRLTNNGQLPDNVKQINCNRAGEYLSECKMGQCQCLNAANGKKLGDLKSADALDCSTTQRLTAPYRMTLNVTFIGRKSWRDLNTRQKEKFSEITKRKIETKYQVTITKAEYRSGSIIGTLDVEKSCEPNCDVSLETPDLASIVEVMRMDVIAGEISVEVDGDTFEASSATVVDVVTRADIEGPITTEIPPEDDDNKTTIIIVVVVVVVVVVLVAVGVAFYCYTKANKSKNKDIPFSDIQGKSNPAYDNLRVAHTSR